VEWCESGLWADQVECIGWGREMVLIGDEQMWKIDLWGLNFSFGFVFKACGHDTQHTTKML